jgi:hypothetical protein
VLPTGLADVRPNCLARRAKAERTVPSYTSLPILMRIPPMRSGLCTNDDVTAGPYLVARPFRTRSRKSAGMGIAVSTWAACLAYSCLSRHRKRFSTSKYPWLFVVRSFCATARARPSSSFPPTRQNRKTCLALRSYCRASFKVNTQHGIRTTQPSLVAPKFPQPCGAGHLWSEPCPLRSWPSGLRADPPPA